MKYSKEIDEAFASLKLSPRHRQKEIINEILVEFFDNRKSNVILSAPTGTGKSIIGAVVARVFSNKFMKKAKNSVILMHTNSLVDQYTKAFSRFPVEEFTQIKGASNYRCDFRTDTSNKEVTAEYCIKKNLTDDQKERFCSNCEFNIAKSHVSLTENLITNYSYYFITKLAGIFNDRKITIFDEAHLINDVFCSHNEIKINIKKLERHIEECLKYFPSLTTDQVKIFKQIIKSINNKKINEDNYTDYLKKLYESYTTISLTAFKKSSTMQMKDSMPIEKLLKKYKGYASVIKDFFQYKYEHVFDFNEKELSFTVKPIFIGNMSKVLLGEYNLFMSATISDTFMNTTLKLDEHKTSFIKMPPVFDPKRKSVSFENSLNLNYRSLQNNNVIKSLENSCKELVEYHGKEHGQKGLILGPSFYLCSKIANSLSSSGVRIFEHESGDNLQQMIKRYKEHEGPAILVSPSIFEGLDFPDDDSRYQVILKAPFPSLGEKRMKTILEKYPAIYNIITLKKVVQGIGRSVRSEDDWCFTYILDSNAERLFNSELNAWKDEFHVEK